jgi:hypothetical protein
LSIGTELCSVRNATFDPNVICPELSTTYAVYVWVATFTSKIKWYVTPARYGTLAAAVNPEPFLRSIIPLGLNRTPVARLVYCCAEPEDNPAIAFTGEAEGVPSNVIRNVDPCACDKAAFAHEPEEYSQLAAVVERTFVSAAISKIAKTKSTFQIFKQSFVPGLSISTFKGSIQKFYYSGDRGGRFP